MPCTMQTHASTQPPQACQAALQVIRERRPCHLYMDLEYVPAVNPEADGDALVDALLRLVSDGVRRVRCCPAWAETKQPPGTMQSFSLGEVSATGTPSQDVDWTDVFSLGQCTAAHALPVVPGFAALSRP